MISINMKGRAQARAFTLIELLVVVASIGIVASLLFPAMARAKSRGRSASCKSNLRQVGIALQLYASDHSFYPLGENSFVPISIVGLDSGFIYTMTGLTRYLPANSRVVSCPESERVATMTITIGTNVVPSTTATVFGSYGYNEWGGSAVYREQSLGLGGFSMDGKPNRWVSESAVVAPAQMIAFGDSRNTFGLRIGPNGDATVIPSARHAGGANIVFCDGHVEYAKQSRWIERMETPRRLWNNDNQAHPEVW
jgi:prepilin-type processing-associated H-X9-DG protein/prepilin-type N-terminal cleavage/methylation domain-containing protein